MLDAVCTNVTSSAASRDSAVKLTTDLIPILGCTLKKVSEYDQEIPQSQTAYNPVASRGRAAQPSRDTRKTN